MTNWSSDVCSSDLTMVSLILDVVVITPITTESVHQVSLGRLGCIKKRVVMTDIIPVFHQITFEGVDGSRRFKINQTPFKILPLTNFSLCRMLGLTNPRLKIMDRLEVLCRKTIICLTTQVIHRMFSPVVDNENYIIQLLMT